MILVKPKFLVYVILAVLAGTLVFSCSDDRLDLTENQNGTPTSGGSQTGIAAVGPSGIAGVNWADGRDNFVDGWVIPSGLTASDSYSTVSSKANAILTGFQNRLPGVNAVRLPINPSSVLETWWNSYKGAIDVALSKNMKVILAYWEGASSRDGKIDNTTQFWNMWQVVVNQYAGNANVYFEPFNEPHGYTLSELTTIYAEWLTRYSSVPKGRILLGGTGYSDDVKGVGADSRFNGCLLSLHNYAFWNTSRVSVAEWEQSWRSQYGPYASRTVVTEFGAAMTTGKNYLGHANGDHEIAYIQGSTNVFRADGVSSVYWPGLRDGDSYSITTRSGSGTNITLSTTNASGAQRIRYGWGESVSGGGAGSFNGSVYYRLVNRNSGKVADVNGGSTADGAQVIQWQYNGGTNQQWQLVHIGEGFYRVVNRKSGKNLDVNGGSLNAGANIIQWPTNNGRNQQWEIVPTGSGYYRLVNRNSTHVMDVNGASTSNGAFVIQWNWGGGTNQQWQIVQQ
ncbi:MAG TPA: RICIN domain-containing protein [Chryseosolibacter sp.]|nr:RICIN domain-containing protein [Chryseosolibacter sp.]